MLESTAGLRPSHPHSEIYATLRKLRHELVECRRIGSALCHHRIHVEQLVDELIYALGNHDWSEYLVHRLARARRKTSNNGLTRASCQELEMCLQKLRHFEQSLNASDAESSWS